MTEDEQLQKPSLLLPMNAQQMMRIAGIGALVGVVTWGLTLVIDAYVFKSLICQGVAAAQCAKSLDYASIAASILAAGLGAFALAKLQVFRALLVVIAATASVWGLELVLHAWMWPYAALASLLIFAIAYCLFAWIARIRSFLMAVIVMVILIVATRLALNS